jgi:hypothetical protein
MIISLESSPHTPLAGIFFYSSVILGLLLICHLLPCQGLVDVHIFRDSSATWCPYFPVVTKVLPLQRCTSTSLFC